MGGKEPMRCSCGAAMRFTVIADFRLGAGGKVKFLLGESTTADLSLLPLNVYVCPECGKVELFASDAIKDALLDIADKHRQQSPTASL